VGEAPDRSYGRGGEQRQRRHPGGGIGGAWIMPYEFTWTQASLRSVKDLTSSIRQFEIVPAEGSVRDFPPGSHIAVKVPFGGKQESRHYSLTGLRPGDCYRIAVKRLPESRGGSAYMWSLEPGAALTVSVPQTLFEIDWNRPAYRLVAGGIGITPIYGMALRLAERNADVRLAYAVRRREDAAFVPELAAALGDRLEIYASSEGQRLNLDSFFAGIEPGAMAAVCGPLALMNDARRVWAAAGGVPSDLRIETFGSGGTGASEPFVVRLSWHGEMREIAVPETKTMLDALASAGIDVAYDCLRGECGLCVLDVTDVCGQIDHRDVFLSGRQKAANTKICACVSRASGSITIDSAYRES
jgi:dimethylamine monooxygenase subunit B